MNTANREQPGRFPANDESPEIKYAPKSEAEQNRFRSLCNAVKSSSNASRYSLAQMLKLLDNPPLVTFKEAKDAWQSFRDVALHQDMRSALTTRLGDDYGEISIEVLSALIVTTTEIRVSTQSPLIEADTKDEQNDVASLVLSLGHFINFLLTYEQGRVQTPLHDVNLENFTDNILKYAHFEEPSEIYGAIRNQDIELLELMISRTSLDETERVFGILRDQRSMIRYRWSSTSRSRPEIDRIIDQLANRISDRLLDRFSQPDGIEILMKDKFLDEQARQAFAADSPVHFPENRTRLLAIAGDAKNDQAIQRNFLSYFNMLSYIAVRGSSFYDQVQCKALVNDHNFIDAIWSAAVASPLNLRVVGSLRDYRQELITKLSVPNECLREPEWYRAMVSYHWANGPENADNVNTESDDL